MNKLFASSVNPEKLAATWSGAIIMIAATLIPDYNWQGSIGNISDQIIHIIKVVGIIGGSVRTGYGLIRKLLVDVKEVWLDIKSLIVK